MPYKPYCNIDPKILFKAKEHGLKVNVLIDTDADSPRDPLESVFVGVDVEIPRELSYLGCFEDFVASYCHDFLNCDVSDIIWLPVFKYSHGSTAYSVEPFNDRWDSSRAGFIYETKENILCEFEVETINTDLEDLVKSRMTDEIQEYHCWANTEVYIVHVSSADEYFNESSGNVYKSGMDDVADTLIKDMIGAIENDSMKALVKMEIGKLDEGDTVASRINEVLEEQFGFSVSFGKIEQTDTFNTMLPLSDLPKFWHLAEASSSQLFSVVSEKASELDGVNSKYYYLTKMTESTDYKEWSGILMKALILTLFEDIDIADILDISIVTS